MTYSFFGTCSNDNEHLYRCIETIKCQSILPFELIIVDSGGVNQREIISSLLKGSGIRLVYIFEKLARVLALNRALQISTADYLFRFDTRSRFGSDYAKSALNLLNNKQLNLKYVGGVPNVLPESTSRESIICAGIMKRSYIFFYPRHRQINYNGKSSSIYLGCFSSKELQEIKYSEDVNLVSEDSLISANFRDRGYVPFISNTIKLAYVSRSSLKRILMLFHTYGYCRFNTIVSAKKIHSFSRYLFLFFLSILYLICLILNFNLSIIFLPTMILSYNIFGEITTKFKDRSFIYPFLASLCQFYWLIGFVWGLLTSYRINKSYSNFIR